MRRMLGRRKANLLHREDKVGPVELFSEDFTIFVDTETLMLCPKLLDASPRS